MRRTRNRNGGGPPHVACIIETSMAYGREVLRGITRYVREEGPWAIYLEQRSLLDPAPPWLKGWDGDGIITRLSPRLKRIVRASGIATVDLDDQGPASGLPTVQSNHEAIGTMAADHLLERGFTRFAFFGYPRFEWSRRCRDGFAARVRR